MWYAIKASNEATQYGWTEDPAVADAAAAWLNSGRGIGNPREINLFAAEPVDTEAMDRDSEGETEAYLTAQTLIFDDMTRVEDFETEA